MDLTGAAILRRRTATLGATAAQRRADSGVRLLPVVRTRRAHRGVVRALVPASPPGLAPSAWMTLTTRKGQARPTRMTSHTPTNWREGGAVFNATRGRPLMPSAAQKRQGDVGVTHRNPVELAGFPRQNDSSGREHRPPCDRQGLARRTAGRRAFSLTSTSLAVMMSVDVAGACVAPSGRRERSRRTHRAASLLGQDLLAKIASSRSLDRRRSNARTAGTGGHVRADQL
jgi:hypothetical protein